MERQLKIFWNTSDRMKQTHALWIIQNNLGSKKVCSDMTTVKFEEKIKWSLEKQIIKQACWNS